jgi:hypothetical protein
MAAQFLYREFNSGTSAEIATSRYAVRFEKLPNLRKIDTLRRVLLSLSKAGKRNER